MIQFCWMPTWSCQNYDKDGGGTNPKCPYCPLGIKNGRLTFGGKSGCKNGNVDPEEMAAFLLRNRDAIGSQLTISGGEPLASPSLVPVLQRIVANGFTWGITSNTMLHRPLARLSAALHGFSSCQAWTASFHPLAGDSRAELASNLHFLRINGLKYLYVNLVISQETATLAEQAVAWLTALPIDRVNLLVDMYRQSDIDLAVFLAEKHPGKVLPVGSGKTITGTLCRTASEWLVTSPTGAIYQCVRKCYEEIDQIGHISNFFIVNNPTAEWCGLDCSHTCDQVKHAMA